MPVAQRRPGGGGDLGAVQPGHRGCPAWGTAVRGGPPPATRSGKRRTTGSTLDTRALRRARRSAPPRRRASRRPTETTSSVSPPALLGGPGEERAVAVDHPVRGPESPTSAIAARPGAAPSSPARRLPPRSRRPRRRAPRPRRRSLRAAPPPPPREEDPRASPRSAATGRPRGRGCPRSPPQRARVRRLPQRALDRPRGAERLEGRQPEPVRLVLERHCGQPELGPRRDRAGARASRASPGCARRTPRRRRSAPRPPRAGGAPLTRKRGRRLWRHYRPWTRPRIVTTEQRRRAAPRRGLVRPQRAPRAVAAQPRLRWLGPELPGRRALPGGRLPRRRAPAGRTGLHVPPARTPRRASSCSRAAAWRWSRGEGRMLEPWDYPPLPPAARSTCWSHGRRPLRRDRLRRRPARRRDALRRERRGRAVRGERGGRYAGPGRGLCGRAAVHRRPGAAAPWADVNCGLGRGGG